MMEHGHSVGHIAYSSDGCAEWFERDGDVYRSPTANPIMTDGQRCGRWECTLAHFERYKAVIVW